MFFVLSVFSLLFCTFWIIGCRWRFRGTRSNGCHLIDSVVYSNLSEAIALLRDYRFGIEDKESWKSYSNATQPCWKSGQISRSCDIRGIGTISNIMPRNEHEVLRKEHLPAHHRTVHSLGCACGCLERACRVSRTCLQEYCRGRLAACYILWIKMLSHFRSERDSEWKRFQGAKKTQCREDCRMNYSL